MCLLLFSVSLVAPGNRIPETLSSVNLLLAVYDGSWGSVLPPGTYLLNREKFLAFTSLSILFLFTSLVYQTTANNFIYDRLSQRQASPENPTPQGGNSSYTKPWA